ncbi:MAG: hypothetical protein GX595_06755, partial [Lentisphaerae bacterium]|nr:hypothetical protein [Lentisphaerota bacterium]
MRRGCFRVVLAVVVALSSVVSAGPAAVFLEGLQASCAELRLQGARREAAAAAAAERFLAGGTLWVTGSIPRFDIEWLGRAGGLMAVRALREVSAVQPGDVVVYGSRDGAAAADAAWLRPLRERGAMVVVFAPQDAAAAMGTVADACLTAGMASTTPRRGEALAVMAMADLWAFTGDLAAACSRAGRWPVFWQSVMVPGARERNARFRGTTWHEGVAVPPQAPGALGERYLAGIAADLDGLRSQEDRLVAAGAVVRSAWSGGRTVFHANLGHFEPVRLLDAEPPRALRVLTGKDLAADLR